MAENYSRESFKNNSRTVDLSKRRVIVTAMSETGAQNDRRINSPSRMKGCLCRCRCDLGRRESESRNGSLSQSSQRMNRFDGSQSSSYGFTPVFRGRERSERGEIGNHVTRPSRSYSFNFVNGNFRYRGREWRRTSQGFADLRYQSRHPNGGQIHGPSGSRRGGPYFVYPRREPDSVYNRYDSRYVWIRRQPSKEELDREIEDYMEQSKTSLDKELFAYVNESNEDSDFELSDE